MNKRFCRIVQGIYKVGMYLLPWSVPTLIEGPGSVGKLPSIIKDLGYKKVMVVTGNTIRSLGIPDPMLRSLTENGIDYVVFSNLQANPTDQNVMDGLKVFRESGCQAFIAFGGGSPMDCCKAIAALSVKKGKTVQDLQGLFKIRKKVPTIFAVPTTAGTGSETTVAAVVTDSRSHHKASISDTCLIPKFAVLDAELTKDLPPKVTSTTGLDALCHAVEAYTNKTYNTKLEDKFAEDSVKLIYDNLYEAYIHGDNLDARQNMQKAAFLAGRAFTRGSVGYVHAIGHTLSGLYGTSHGLAMAVILPHVMTLYGKAAHKRLARLAEVCGIATNGGDKAGEYKTTGENAKAGDEEKALAFIRWMEDLQAKMDIPKGFDFIEDKDIPQIVDWAMKEGNPLYPVPAVWDKKDFEKAVESIRL